MSQAILFSSPQEMHAKLENRQIIQVMIGNQKRNLTRVDEQVILFEGKCPHFEYPLHQAKINPFGEIVCPWHNYRFNLLSGRESEDRCRKLNLKLASWNDQSQCVVDF
ncbi:MAG: Rieske 2Fe-2S domain-containing protein [Marinoscillum sp.]